MKDYYRDNDDIFTSEKDVCELLGMLWRGLTTCLADMMVQMKIPADTKAMDRYLLVEYLQGDKGK